MRDNIYVTEDTERRSSKLFSARSRTVSTSTTGGITDDYFCNIGSENLLKDENFCDHETRI